MIRTWHYTLWVAAGIALLAALFLTARPASAQQLCAPASDLLRNLETRFGEFIVMRGKTPTGDVVITRSDGGSWSVVVVRGEVGCLIMGGKASELDVGI